MFAFRRPAPEGDDKENIMADMLAMRRAHYAKMFDEHFRETRLATAVRKRLPEPHPRPLALGDLVLVRRNRGKIMRKFESPWEGPHRVVEIHASGVVVEEKEGLYIWQDIKRLDPLPEKSLLETNFAWDGLAQSDIAELDRIYPEGDYQTTRLSDEDPPEVAESDETDEIRVDTTELQLPATQQGGSTAGRRVRFAEDTVIGSPRFRRTEGGQLERVVVAVAANATHNVQNTPEPYPKRRRTMTAAGQAYADERERKREERERERERRYRD